MTENLALPMLRPSKPAGQRRSTVADAVSQPFSLSANNGKNAGARKHRYRGRLHSRRDQNFPSLLLGLANSLRRRTMLLLPSSCWGGFPKRSRVRILLSMLLFSLFAILVIPKLPLSTRRVDHFLTFRVMATHFKSQQQALLDQGVVLPTTKIAPANEINTHAAMRQLLLRREQRAATLATLEQQAVAAAAATTHGKVPRSVFVPKQHAHTSSSSSWELLLRPGRLARHNYTLLVFDEFEMRHLVHDTAILLQPNRHSNQEQKQPNSPLVELYDTLNLRDKLELWSLAAVYFYGGIFVSSFLPPRELVDDFLFGDAADKLVDRQRPPLVLVVDNQAAQKDSIGTENQGISFLAAPPRHALLGCILQGLSDSMTNDKAGGCILRRILGGQAHHSPYSWLPFGSDNDPVLVRQSWRHLSGRTATGPSCSIESCPSEIESALVNALPRDAFDERETDCSMYVRLANDNQGKSAVEQQQPVHVKISSNDNDERPTKTKKSTIQSQLRQYRAEPGWLCNRCLNWAARGTFQTCLFVCPQQYKSLICDVVDPVEKTPVNVELQISGAPSSQYGGVVNGAKAIPRIVHQTWFEEISFDRYPNLARLQSSWTNSGWDFRFYTDETARRYIAENYPYRFLDAFDVLIHGAYKADFFRYLVLLKDGGIYADIDVQLETSLDAFITPSMTFFAPRDIPCEYAGEPFCLWNGFIGAAPGNPIIVRAVERLVNLIQERADIYDMERETCSKNGGSMDMWKVRAQPLLFMSGPCALGVAMNEALNRSSLATLPIGWLGMDELETGGRKDHGDALVMIGDKYDLGEFRFSDPERHFIVASTDIEDLDKSPREQHVIAGASRRKSLRRQPLPHYSNSKRGVSLWGTANVYKNDLVANELIRFRVQYIDDVS